MRHLPDSEGAVGCVGSSKRGLGQLHDYMVDADQDGLMNKSRWWVFPLAFIGLLAACGSSSADHPVVTIPIKIQITLAQTRVIAGASINGEAVLTNTTSKAVTVDSCAADGWLEVGLVSKQITFEPATPLIVCPPTIRLSPGPNRFPLTVSTSYESCFQPGGSATTDVPPCTATGPPAPPAGKYTIKVITSGLPLGTSRPQPISVTLLPIRG